MLFKATIEILLDVETEAEACDALSEGLRPLLRNFAKRPEQTAFIDWRYSDSACLPLEDDGAAFEYTA